MEKQLKLYIGNLDRSVTESMLHFEFFGGLPLYDIRIICDPRTGKSKGFGFVVVANDEDARALIGAYNQRMYKNKLVSISYAKETTAVSERPAAEKTKQQDSNTMSRRKAAKRNFKRSKDDDFNGPWR